MIKIEFDSISDFLEFSRYLLEPVKEEADLEVETVDTQYTTDADDDFEDQVEDDEDLSVDPLLEVVEVPYLQRYKYDFYKCYFKTPKGRKRILLTGSEALDIIPLIKEGKGARSIWNHMQGDFYHEEVTLTTLKTFIRRYKQGKLNDAIKMYCENWRVREDPYDFLYGDF